MLALLLSLLLGVPPTDVPIDAPVVDLTGTLSRDALADLDTRVRTLRADHSGVQLAIVIVASVDGEPIEDWGVALFGRWQLGEAGRDDGLLAVFALDDHLARLEVGYGLEPYLSDADAQRILDGLRDELRANDVHAALVELVTAIDQSLAEYEPGGTGPTPKLGQHGASALVLVLVGIAAGIGFALVRRRLGRRELALRNGDAAALKKATRNRKVAPWIIILGGLVACAVVFHRGHGFWWATGLWWLAWLVTGARLVGDRKRAPRASIVVVVLLAAVLVLWVRAVITRHYASGADLIGSELAIWVVFMIVDVVVIAVATSQTRTSSGTSYRTGSSIDRDVPDRPTRHHTPSHSSGWSGGGGRSGGGGATSSW